MRIKWFSAIRVTGLVLVLLYHFFIKYFPGGFVGVDVFFTFSGYLITALLIDEYVAHQKIDLKAFFRRRFYRIVPPLVLTILLTLPLSLLVRNDFRAGIGRQITASIGFVTNWFEILSGGNYENQFTPHLFVHTWSLAIEVQYYILWALLVWGLTKVAKSVGQLRGFLFVVSGGLFLLSFLSMFVSSFLTDSFSTIYFSTFTHIFPFFLGSLLATIAGVSSTVKGFQRIVQQWPIKKTLATIGGALATLLLLLFVLHFETIWTYLFGFVIASVATTVFIFAARVLHEQTPDTKEPAALLFLSDISYSVYLFHWPFYIIFNLATNHWLAVLLTTVLSILLASLSYYLLEPFVAGKTSRIFSVDIDLFPYTKWITGSLGVLALIGLVISLTAPALGNFESDIMVKGLKQADTQIAQTKTFAEKGKATSYEVTEGTLIIGDSVTLAALDPLQEALPEANIDAQISRNTQQAEEILQNNITNGTLLGTVVIATGVNTIANYQEELDAIVSILPKGYRLIFVTPYNGETASDSNSRTELHAAYVRELATKYDFITVADWNTIAKENPQIWDGSDNVHFEGTVAATHEGGQLYATMIATAVTEAASKPVKQ